MVLGWECLTTILQTYCFLSLFSGTSRNLPGTYPIILLLLLLLHFLGHKWKIKGEESDSWLKTYVWLFRPDPRQWQRLYLEGPQWESYPPHPRLGVPPRHYSLWRELQPRAQVPLASLASPCICICSLSAFMLRPWAEVFFRRLCWGPLSRRGGGNLKTVFPTLTEHFSTHSPSPSPSPWPQGS